MNVIVFSEKKNIHSTDNVFQYPKCVNDIVLLLEEDNYECMKFVNNLAEHQIKFYYLRVQISQQMRFFFFFTKLYTNHN
jgi:hypothetical protein